jgi:Pyruvate/2-oxoacid:ferredoxin oxidoreductase delta subunit
MTLALTVSVAALATFSWAHWRVHQRRLAGAGSSGGPWGPGAHHPGRGRSARSARGGSLACYAVDPLRCTRCEACAKVCPTGALRRTPEGMKVEPALCQACGRCAERCRRGAILRIRAAA